MSTMKAVRFSEFGAPEKVLRVEDVPLPEPGPDDVLIRLQARPINPADLYLVMGRYGVRPQLPATAGIEGAGTIEAVGANVTNLSVGQKVVPLKSGVGMWQEYITAPAAQVLPLPPTMDIEAASMLVANPMSAYLMTRVLMEVPEGAWLLQTAAGSALGQMVIQLGKIFGFKTINVVRRREQVQEILDMGGDAAISTENEDLVDRVQAITGGKGVKYAIDAVAGIVGTQVVNALGVGGTMVIYGALDQAEISINPGAAIFKEFTVKGFWLTRWIGSAPPELRAKVFGELIPLVMSGQLGSKVAAKYPLSDITAAVTHAQQAARGGKILLVG